MSNKVLLYREKDNIVFVFTNVEFEYSYQKKDLFFGTITKKEVTLKQKIRTSDLIHKAIDDLMLDYHALARLSGKKIIVIISNVDRIATEYYRFEARVDGTEIIVNNKEMSFKLRLTVLKELVPKPRKTGLL